MGTCPLSASCVPSTTNEPIFRPSHHVELIESHMWFQVSFTFYALCLSFMSCTVVSSPASEWFPFLSGLPMTVYLGSASVVACNIDVGKCPAGNTCVESRLTLILQQPEISYLLMMFSSNATVHFYCVFALVQCLDFICVAQLVH